ncbi:MAG: carboxypeptidase regulatory-like domain-containing protein [Acidobacteriota bacterium]
MPARIDFGLVWAAARIDGRVISDAGIGVPGVVLSVAAPNGTPIGATSDAEGRFVFAVPPGTFRVTLNAASLPAGYSIAGQHERSVTVEADQPQQMSFEVAALRSVAGRAAAASEVRIESLKRTAVVDAEGNFVFRSMPSGTFTITACGASGTVTLPAGPAMVRDISSVSFRAKRGIPRFRGSLAPLGMTLSPAWRPAHSDSPATQSRHGGGSRSWADMRRSRAAARWMW